MRTVIICTGCDQRAVVLEDDWYLIRDYLEERGWHSRAGQWLCPACDEKGIAPGERRVAQKMCQHCHRKPVASNFHHYCSEDCRLAAQEERGKRQVKVS